MTAKIFSQNLASRLAAKTTTCYTSFYPERLTFRPLSAKTQKYFTASLISISENVLSGEYVDMNSRFLALSLETTPFQLRKAEVIPTVREDIEESIAAHSKKYDIVFVSGGISMRHTVKTYEIVADMYGQELAYHQPTLDRMDRDSGYLSRSKSAQEYQQKKKMALLPEGSKIVFPWEEHWGNIVVVNNKIHMLSGVPPIFKGLVENYFTAPIASFLGLQIPKEKELMLASDTLKRCESSM
ncbi:hypothetical protein DSO57_1000009 [Entomophthora muscae]|uniref:Uncharacterized protein n=1 Tax=Entomophthora muscae TaxID=34485 RepID=A0ACC2SM30_9FUNG|nr:hypothetical protein DSO57_1000009 [Entomophthora muscae]